MKLLKLMKDGGPESRVWGYWLIEWKKLFSVVLLHFKDGSREAYHSHAFNSISWVLRGKLTENRRFIENGQLTGWQWTAFKPSFLPIWTSRANMHRVTSAGDTWVLSFRGPWADRWQEYIPAEDTYITLTHGRKVVSLDSR